MSLTGDAIAIVGASCRFPGANNLAEFWDVLSSGRDVITEIPDERWSKPYYFHPGHGQPGKSYTWAAGVVEKVDYFDAAFFGISPREARQMDPQQRLILETAWEALEDAGLRAARLAGSGAGVYVGVSSVDYATLRIGDPASGDAYFMTGMTNSIVANRISYIFDLRGPSFAVDTACSSSLVALDLACDALRQERVPVAIVGGVNLLLAPFSFIGFCQASMLSPTGRCHAFDARADGYVRAEGAGVVILKRLQDAVADGDPIRGLILGTGVNSDGHTLGLSLPSQASQSALLTRIYRTMGLAPSRLAFVEAHGTGTQAGDPIELAALGTTLARQRTEPLLVGSAKTNVGHLETASGMAGLIKTMLAIQHRELPASLHFKSPNPKISFAELNIEIAAQKRALSPDGDLIAGVNSFGFGGTNAHAVLASPPPPPHAPPSQPERLPALLLSARSAAALNVLARDWSARLAGVTADDAARLLRAAATHRDHHRHRLYSVVTDPKDLVATLSVTAAGEPATGVVTGIAASSERLAFVFAGNGAQYLGMARDALQYNTSFRDGVRAVDDAMASFLGWSIEARLQDDDPDYLRRTDVAQPLLFAVQVGIVTALRAVGIDADSYLGHSVGEIAAAWAAGALSLETAARVVVARSHQQHRTFGEGGMAALALEPEVAASELAKFPDLELAAINSRGNVTIAGSRISLNRLEQSAKAQGWHYTALDIEYPFHSSMLDRIRADLLDELGQVATVDCGSRFISAVSGAAMPGTKLGARYWWENIRRPVQFRDGVAQLIASDIRIFIEIGPHPILQSYLRDGLRAADVDGRVLSTLSRTQSSVDPFLKIAGLCYVAGYNLAAHSDFAGPCDIAGLPRYPWQKERFWYQPTSDGLALSAPFHDHPLLGFRWRSDATEWTQLLDLERLPWLEDHAVEDIAILPATAMLEIALAVAHTRQPDAPQLALEELEIHQAISFTADQTIQLRIRLEGEHSITMDSSPRLSGESNLVNAVARIAPQAIAEPPRLGPPKSTSRIDSATVYALARALGLDYGPAFRVISHVDVINENEAHAWFSPKAESVAAEGYLVTPQLLDGGLQALLGLLADHTVSRSEFSLLPWRFAGVRIFAPFGRSPARAHITLTHRGTRSASAAIVYYDASDRAVAHIEEVWLRRVRLTRRETDQERTFYFSNAAVPQTDDDISPSCDPIDLVRRLSLENTVPHESAVLLEGYIVATAHAALLQRFPPAVPFSLPDPVDPVTNTRPLVTRLLQLLAAHGMASEQTPDQWRLYATTDLPPAAPIWRTVMDEAPHMPDALALAAAAREKLTYLLGGAGVPPESPPTSLVEQFLFVSPVGLQVMDALRSTLVRLATQWPNDKPLRILEIGAGSGLVARRILSDLSEWQGTLSYVATDPDANVVRRMSSQLAKFRDAAAMVWEPNSTNATIEAQTFDIIVSAYAFTRKQWGAGQLAGLRRRLAPNGLIMMAEPQPNALWDWIFGQDAGWWSRSNAGTTLVSPLRPITMWRDMLASIGFCDLATADLAANPWPAGIVLGRATPIIDETVDCDAREGGMTIIVAEHDDGRAVQLAQRLISAGVAAEIIVPPEIGDGNLFCALLMRADAAIPQVVVLPPREAAEADLVGATNTNLLRAITIAQLIAGTRDRTRLWIVTEDAQQATGAVKSREDAALWGLGRTLANEMPQLECGLIDLPGNLDTANAAARLATELLHPDGEREIVITSKGRRALRLRRGTPAAPNVTRLSPVRLAIATPGRLDTLYWDSSSGRTPRKGEVAIAVHVADLNFRDVMWALDLLPEEAVRDGHAGPTFGLACGGMVTAVGPGVVDFQPGDRVLAIAPATLASETVTAAYTVARLPDGLDFAAAATLPVAFITAIYALGHLAQLQPGERVLIHGGAGGVGLAAIQYALHRGAEVIATSGSPTKRAFLREFGAHHVFDSRDLAFVDAIRQLTDGAGIDVVLNSLSGDAMEQSMALLRPFGRFVELGKRDFFQGTRVGLRPLRKNISYFAVDIDTLAIERPSLAAGIMRQTIDLIEKGALRPLPYRCFPHAEIVDAFRLMQSSGHVGKILLDMSERARSQYSDRPLPPELRVRADRTYLISGGLSGFGLATAEWLAQRGARSLALIGRRGITTPGAAEALVRMAASGVDARAFACDVADRSQLDRTLEAIRREMPPLVGVFHAAMALEDGLIATLDSVRMARALAPKLGGAHHLDELTRSDPIELFVLYSSATTLLGAPGQGSYVAANTALEGIVRQRRFRGLPGLVIGWGPLDDVGYLARNNETRDALSRRLSANSLKAKEALDALPGLWTCGEAVVAFASVRWESAQQLLSTLSSPTFADLIGNGGDASTGDLQEKLKTASIADRKDIILSVLMEELVRILATTSSNLDPHRPVAELGMDSLIAVELRLALERRLGINLPMLSLTQQTSLAMIAADFAQRLSAVTDVRPDITAAALRHEIANPKVIMPPTGLTELNAELP